MGTNIVPMSENKTHLGKVIKVVSKLDARNAAYTAANVAEAKKAESTLILDVRDVTILADYFVITGGSSISQVRAIVEAIDEALVVKYGLKARSIEGKKEGRWVLMDYESIMVHVLQEKERNYYKLEQFWNHALIVNRHDWYKIGV